MLANESQACFIGYGGMLMESFVAIMALVAACIIDPGVYFAMNSPMAVLAPHGYHRCGRLGSAGGERLGL